MWPSAAIALAAFLVFARVKQALARPSDCEPTGSNRHARFLGCYVIHDALPAGWTVGPPTYDPGVPGWSVTARTVAASRLKRPRTVTGTGVDETGALRDLDDRLRGVPQPDGSRMTEPERRLRLAYVEGAEEWSRETTGRQLTEGELEGVIRRFR